MAQKVFKLNTGADIPALGLGTWQSSPGEVKAAVLHALQLGYRHIDCAFAYDNEDEVGAAFKEAFSSGICKREDVFVTSKVWCTFHSRVEKSLDMSLKALGLDYLDLLLVHWPLAMNPKGNHPTFPTLPDGTRDMDFDWKHTETWKLMEEVVKTGKTKAIGVSNYSEAYLRELLAGAKVVPAVNQIENHPYLPQQEAVDFCKEHGILVTAYSPLGSTGSPLMKEPAVVTIAERRGVSAGCVLLSYHIARGSGVLAKSVTPSRIEENMHLIDLSADELKALEDISKTHGVQRFVAPPFLKLVNLKFPDVPFPPKS